MCDGFLQKHVGRDPSRARLQLAERKFSSKGIKSSSNNSSNTLISWARLSTENLRFEYFFCQAVLGLLRLFILQATCLQLAHDARCFPGLALLQKSFCSSSRTIFKRLRFLSKMYECNPCETGQTSLKGDFLEISCCQLRRSCQVSQRQHSFHSSMTIPMYPRNQM